MEVPTSSAQTERLGISGPYFCETKAGPLPRNPNYHMAIRGITPLDGWCQGRLRSVDLRFHPDTQSQLEHCDQERRGQSRPLSIVDDDLRA